MNLPSPLENLPSKDQTRAAALELTRKGYTVFHLPDGEKFTRGWQAAATNNPAEVEKWQLADTETNLAIVGRGGLLVLDVDTWDKNNGTPKSGESDLKQFEAILGPLPQAPIQFTWSGGRHLFFKRPPELEIKTPAHIKFPSAATYSDGTNKQGSENSNLDLRTGESFVIVSPSRYIPKEGETGPDGTSEPKNYYFPSPLPHLNELPDLPKRWLDYFLNNGRAEETAALPLAIGAATPTNYTSSKSAEERARAFIDSPNTKRCVSGQGGDEQLLIMASNLINGFCLDKTQALPLLEYYNQTKCDPPWSRDRLEYKLQEAEKHQDPRGYGFLLNATFSPSFPDSYQRQPRDESFKATADIPEEAPAVKPVSSFLDDILKRFEDGLPDPIITGWNNLDEALDGGIYPNLFVLGGLPGLGKTTFALQLADQIAEQQRRVLFFSLEMSRLDLVAKSISRITGWRADLEYLAEAASYEEGAEYFFSGISSARAIQRGKAKVDIYPGTNEMYKERLKMHNSFYEDALEYYQKNIADYMTIIEAGEAGRKYTITELAKEVEKQIAERRKPDFIVVDYLQILDAIETGLSDKQKTDQIITGLVRLKRAYGIPLLVISSLNRVNYGSEISLEALKESGGIEYSAEVVMGLQDPEAREAVEKAKAADKETVGRQKRLEGLAKDDRSVELVVLKNRSGRTGGKAHFTFFPKANYYSVHNNPLGMS